MRVCLQVVCRRCTFTSTSEVASWGKMRVGNLKSGLNAVSLSPDGNFLACGGRVCLKILSTAETDGEALPEHRNLRVGKHQNLNYATIDVKWHPTKQHLIATAATNGNVVIWNIAKTGTASTQARNIAWIT